MYDSCYEKILFQREVYKIAYLTNKGWNMKENAFSYDLRWVKEGEIRKYKRNGFLEDEFTLEEAFDLEFDKGK